MLQGLAIAVVMLLTVKEALIWRIYRKLCQVEENTRAAVPDPDALAKIRL
jgi:hypothetical protein